MKTIKLLFLLGSIIIIAWSCSDPSSLNTNKDWSILPYANATKFAAPADSLMGLAQQIPGFGGLFLNKSGRLTIYLTHPTKQKVKAKVVLSNSKLVKDALSNTSASVDNIVIKKGSYTFIQLHTWKTQVSRKIFPMDGVYMDGIDQSRNKVDIGVKNKAVRGQVIKKLQQINIPRQAVIFFQMTPPVLD